MERVSVGVIATDAHGQFIEGLRREDFRVFDDGVEQPLTDFAPVDDPAAVFLLFEAGPAVVLLESGHLRAASALLDGLAPADSVAIAAYAAKPLPVLEFTADKQAAASALANVRFNIGFGSLNLSESLATVLGWLAAVPGKKTVVLLSTGVDTSSASAWENLLLQLRSGDVRVLAVSLAGELRPAPSSKKQKASSAASSADAGFAEADARLSAIAEASGGRVLFPRTAAEFFAAFAQIALLVRHEYSLAFAPPVRDGKLHSIEVRISPAADSRADAVLRLSHRRAYLAPR